MVLRTVFQVLLHLEPLPRVPQQVYRKHYSQFHFTLVALPPIPYFLIAIVVILLWLARIHTRNSTKKTLVSFKILKNHASFNSSIQKGSFRIYLQLFHFSLYCHSKTDQNLMCDSATSELLLERDHIKRKSVYFTDTNKFTHKGSNVNVCRKCIKICQFLNCNVILPFTFASFYEKVIYFPPSCKSNY